jgi:superfamily II DNA or RNA helicase
MTYTQQMIDNLDAFLRRCAAGQDKILKPRQVETICKIRDFLSAGFICGHVVKPTGIGKTVIFTKLLEAALAGLPVKAYVVGPTKTVLHQNRWKFEAFAGLQAGAYYGQEKNLRHQITVSTYSSLMWMLKKQHLDPEEECILILDEAHRALGAKTIAAIERFKNSIKIGFTATPEFDEEKSVAHLLPHRIDEMSVREAIEDSLLAGLKVLAMPTGQSLEEVTVKGGDFEEISLTKLVNNPKRNKFIAKLCSSKRFAGKRKIMNAASISHAEALLKAIAEEKVKAEMIIGTTPEFDEVDPEDENNAQTGRVDIFERFKTGVTEVLVNVRVCVEGFDEPEAEVCINAVPTLSKVVAEQRGGRVLRLSRIKDQKIGYVVEVIDEFGMSGNTPVLFSEIAGSAEILPPNTKPPRINQKPQKRRKPQDHSKRAGVLIDDVKVVMGLTNKNRKQRFTKMFQYAPKGWAYARRLAHELHIKESEVRIFAEQHLNENPGWFKRYLTVTDILVTHYHPKLADKVRRHFVRELKGMVLAEEFAELTNVSPEKAEERLEAADSQASKKALRFGYTAYYSMREHAAIIRVEAELARQYEQELVSAAEEAYWADDERSEEEREIEYWREFDPITSQSKGVEVDPPEELIYDPLLDGEATVSYDEQVHQDADSNPDSLTLSNYQRAKVRRWLGFLHPALKTVMYEVIWNEKSMDYAAQKAGRSKHMGSTLYWDAVEFLKRRKLLLYIWDLPHITDPDLVASWRPNPDLPWLSDTDQKLLCKLTDKYRFSLYTQLIIMTNG